MENVVSVRLLFLGDRFLMEDSLISKNNNLGGSNKWQTSGFTCLVKAT